MSGLVLDGALPLISLHGTELELLPIRLCENKMRGQYSDDHNQLHPIHPGDLLFKLLTCPLGQRY